MGPRPLNFKVAYPSVAAPTILMMAARLVTLVLATTLCLLATAAGEPVDAAIGDPAAVDSSTFSSTGGTVTFSNKNRFLFDVDGNQVDAYAAKINCRSIHLLFLS